MEMKVSGQDALASWASIDGATEIVLTEEGIVVPRASRCGPDARTMDGIRHGKRRRYFGPKGPQVVGEGGLAHPQASFWTLHDFPATSAPFSGVV
jgi:hypothetical protein